MPRRLTYAGIGSRETPQDVLRMMENIGHQLGESGWWLRSGNAVGADQAFENGHARANPTTMEIYLPWKGFNGKPARGTYILPDMSQQLLDYAGRFHPAWHRVSPGGKRLHARNVCQLLGHTPKCPDTDMVVCWTKDGKAGGGTGQAIRIANENQIPVFDLAIDGALERLIEYVTLMEKAQ